MNCLLNMFAICVGEVNVFYLNVIVLLGCAVFLVGLSVSCLPKSVCCVYDPSVCLGVPSICQICVFV